MISKEYVSPSVNIVAQKKHAADACLAAALAVAVVVVVILWLP